MFRSRDIKNAKLYCSTLKNSKLGKVPRINMFTNLNTNSSITLEICE